MKEQSRDGCCSTDMSQSSYLVIHRSSNMDEIFIRHVLMIGP